MKFTVLFLFSANSLTLTGAFVLTPSLQWRPTSCSSCFPVDAALLHRDRSSSTLLWMSAVDQTPMSAPPPVAEEQSILAELRDTAMKLHTREQAPREGQAPSPKKPSTPFVPTHSDYLQFLVDSLHVYTAFEEVVSSTPELAGRFSDTGLERTEALKKDIEWMVNEYDLIKPDVGEAGKKYADELRDMIAVENGVDCGIPEFVCHYYNFYFAHLAGGRMIGKQMSSLLLNGETLEFYKWGDNVNELKAKVKADIEDMAKTWTREDRDKCINATAGAFQGGGAINGYLFGGNQH